MASIGHVFDMLIQAEGNAEKFYCRVAEMFSMHPEIALYWQRFAKEERGHQLWLERLRSSSSEDFLAQPADTLLVEQSLQVALLPLEEVLNNIKTLQDAYQAASKIEHAEASAVFEFLIEYYAKEEKTRDFLRSYLHDHSDRLMLDFTVRFGTGTLRRGILARRPTDMEAKGAAD